MTRIEESRETLRNWYTALEWENMIGRPIPVPPWRDSLGPEDRYEGNK